MKSTTFDLDAEQALLGSILLDPRRIDEALALVQPLDLSPTNGHVLQAMIDLIAENPNVDPDVRLVLSRLRSTPKHDEPQQGWSALLASFLDPAPLAIHLPHYCERIRETAIRGRLRVVAEEVKALAADSSLSAREAIAEVQSRVNAACEAGQRETVVQIDAPVEHEFEQCISSTAEVDVVPSGFGNLDQLLAGGFRPGQFVVLAARTGMGKTAIAANIAGNVARDSGPVLFASLEMSIEQLSQRFLASEAQTSLTAIRMRNLTSVATDRVRDAAMEIKGLPLFVQCGAGLRPGEIISAARRIRRQKGLRLLVIDYVQLLLPDRGRKFETREREIAGITRALKIAAQEMGVPVLCLAQLSRKADEQNVTPSLSHLRESGALEQDADIVLFVHRDKNVEVPVSGAVEAQLIVAKNRDGRCHHVNLLWHGAQVRFVDCDRDHEQRGLVTEGSRHQAARSF